MKSEINSGSPIDAVAAAFIGSYVLGAGNPNAFGTFSGAVLSGFRILCDGYRQRNSSK
ncbi:hypothetical protein JMN23_18045 [Bacillus sp. RHFB]|nr:hypothetical protein [Bacillus sp. RHFB]